MDNSEIFLAAAEWSDRVCTGADEAVSALREAALAAQEASR
jgi:hypothetical protein